MKNIYQKKLKHHKLFFTLLLGFFFSILMFTETNAQTEIILTGQAAGDQFGVSVSAGDVNGDGYNDFIVGAMWNDAGGSYAGRSYIYFGGISMDNIADVTMTGEAAGDWFGYSVSTAGDVNGDGYSDVIVGAMDNRAGGIRAGRVYIYYGGTIMDNTADVIMTGEAAEDRFGNWVSTAGDVNGDGYSDVIVGSTGNDAGGTSAGRSYIYFGGISMDNIVDVIITGEASGHRLGNSVSTAGDVNGDGYSDVIVGAYFNDAGGRRAGRSYIYFGGTSMDNLADVVMTGEAAGDYFGESVSTAGDVNGDGYNDVIVGAFANDAGGVDAGRSYIYFGGILMDNLADVIMTGEAADDFFGYATSIAGDVNGDGYSDVIVGAYQNDTGGDNAGRSYIYFGGTSMDNIADVIMTGEAAYDNFGYSVYTTGDVNGDGYNNVIIGAWKNDAGGNNAGRAYIYAIFVPEFGIISGTVSVSGNGLTSVTVKLLDEAGLPVAGFDDINTDTNGDYSFTDVPAGDYQVMIVEPPGYEPDGNPKLGTVEPNQDLIIDFQLTQLVGDVAGTVSVSGTGLENVLVKLLDEFGFPVDGFDDVYTDTNGEYSFIDVPIGNYQVMIVEPLGYMVDLNPKPAVVLANETTTVDFSLTEVVVLNNARSKGYWKHQFDVYVKGRGHAEESEQDLIDYIALVHQHYTLYYDIFTDVNTNEEWQAILSLKGNHPMADRAKQHLSALILNMVSNKIGQYTVVTADGRGVGDVVQYVSELIIDGDDTNDELAKDLAESVNNQQMIDAGIVPEGSILFKTGEGSKNIEVTTYELFDNYPNPFNPATTIKYQTPDVGFVTLKVYDVLGNEVATLVNERKEEGRYQITFDASALSSGVYIYQIRSGDFIDTKKMILMK